MLLTGCGVIYANGIYLKKQLVYQSTALAMNRVISDMEATPGYELRHTPVAMHGNLGTAMVYREGYGNYNAVGMWTNSAITYPDTLVPFMEQVMAYPIRWVSDETTARLQANGYFDSMPAYPVPGYCRMVDGVLLVKLDE